MQVWVYLIIAVASVQQRIGAQFCNNNKTIIKLWRQMLKLCC